MISAQRRRSGLRFGRRATAAFSLLGSFSLLLPSLFSRSFLPVADRRLAPWRPSRPSTSRARTCCRPPRCRSAVHRGGCDAQLLSAEKTANCLSRFGVLLLLHSLSLSLFALSHAPPFPHSLCRLQVKDIKHKLFTGNESGEAGARQLLFARFRLVTVLPSPHTVRFLACLAIDGNGC